VLVAALVAIVVGWFNWLEAPRAAEVGDGEVGA
jgi:hypothetical protein